MNTVELAEEEPEIDVSGWESSKSAKKYRAIIKKSEKILKTNYNRKLNDFVLSLKRALVTEEEPELIEVIKTGILDIIYDLENDV